MSKEKYKIIGNDRICHDDLPLFIGTKEDCEKLSNYKDLLFNHPTYGNINVLIRKI
jgi:hypothetical protein